MDTRKLYRDFMESQKRVAREYREDGVSEETIRELLNLNKQDFLNDIKYRTHNQSFDYTNDDFDAETQNPLMEKYFENFVVYQEEMHMPFPESFDSEDFREFVLGLSKLDCTILELYLEGLTRVDIGVAVGMTPQGVGYRISNMKKELKKIAERIYPQYADEEVE